MTKQITQAALALVLLIASVSGVWLYHQRGSAESILQQQLETQEADHQRQTARMQQEIDAQAAKAEEMRKRAEELKQVVKRIETEHRAAEIMVTDRTESAGVMRTTLQFVECDRDGKELLPGREYVIEGRRAHIDAMMVKFDGKFVEENDPLRNHSIALFTGLYDQTHSPANQYPIDQPGNVPEGYRSPDQKVSAFEQELWNNFWKLAADPAYRKSMGVRVAQGEGVWGDFEPGYLYHLTVEANGGVSMVNEPLTGIVQQTLMKKLAETNPTTQP